MFELKKNLEPQNNKLTSFFPINTKDRKDIFDWDSVLGHFVKYCYRKQVSTDEFDKFQEACKSAFEAKLDVPEFWPVIERMYFENDELYKISPELLLFKAQKVQGNSANERLGDFFLNLLQNFYIEEKVDTKLNFIEEEIVQSFNNFVIQGNPAGTVTAKTNEEPYLPFISKKFEKDLRFLNSKPKYFLSSITDFLKLYAFLYTAQLSINISEWSSGEPSSKRCYFIMDNEKASDERTWVKDFGYTQLERNFEKIFPFLAMSESLQESGTIKVPLWKLNELLKGTDSTELLHEYALKFKDNRKLKTNILEPDNTENALSNLLTLSLDQFAKGESRYEINTLYCKAIETELCGHFIQNRRRAGRVLVFNQDYILLLTNIAIAEREQLRLHELLKEFEARGVYFDKQSQKQLVDFYERIGNVERKSDSGDAVYVRKTV
ncbi:DNA phosphorothioation-dependent restriction protein DptG [Psychrobium sp. MM17-31]|uniref:DNA phosphorothioation-dependent restriction protein DptG n=1 Tax=Psychrobium sp. MM17-31 TaxID=2917758 RepID=UPI001EF60751|nr:DNA phosphorothioation-dependent restriction protein DptG [Psychrobium sp. MM17-31]MCG7532632.1 DNA phosphorothioation-dependent restriction protein DptG [Psychrobium sp. MM17-31]